jgi:hypothetical protein
VQIESSSAATLETSRRLHERFGLNNSEHCYLELQGRKYPILDLSYKGALVAFQKDSSVSDVTGKTTTQQAVVHIMSHKFSVIIESLVARQGGMAAIFLPLNQAAVFEYSSLVNLLRRGKTCIEVDRGNDDGFNRASLLRRKRYIGDGPLDLVVERAGSGEFVFGMVTLRTGTVYGTVILEKGTIVTKKSIDARGVSARMSQTNDVDKVLVESAFIACLTFKNPDGALISNLLGDWLHRAFEDNSKN